MKLKIFTALITATFIFSACVANPTMNEKVTETDLGMATPDRSGDTIKIVPVQNNVIINYNERFENGLVLASDAFKSFFIDTTGKVVYSTDKPLGSTEYSEDGIYVPSYANANFAIDTKNKKLIQFNFEQDVQLFAFNEALFVVSKGNFSLNDVLYGYIDRNGETVIPFKYTKAFPFINGLAVCCSGNKYGVIDKTGNIVIPFQYNFLKSDISGKGFIFESDDSKQGFIDNSGQIIIEPKYYMIGGFYEDITWVCTEDGNPDKFAYIDITGKEIVPLKYDGVDDFAGNYAGNFSEGMCSVSVDSFSGMAHSGMANPYIGKWGYINTSGEEVVPLIYEFTGEFKQGYAPVKKDDKLGFIDKTGKLVVPCIYDFDKHDLYSTYEYPDAPYFANGLARVKKAGKFGFVDTSGNEVIDFNYDYASNFIGNFALVGNSPSGKIYFGERNSDAKFGFIDKAGNLVIEMEYDYVSELREGFALARKNGNWFVITIPEM